MLSYRRVIALQGALVLGKVEEAYCEYKQFKHGKWWKTITFKMSLCCFLFKCKSGVFSYWNRAFHFNKRTALGLYYTECQAIPPKFQWLNARHPPWDGRPWTRPIHCILHTSGHFLPYKVVGKFPTTLYGKKCPAVTHGCSRRMDNRQVPCGATPWLP